MSLEISYTEARDHLASYMLRAIEDNEVIKIRRKINGKNQEVALIAADELESLLETAHLLRSPKNAERLFKAFEELERLDLKTSSLAELRREFGLESELSGVDVSEKDEADFDVVSDKE